MNENVFLKLKKLIEENYNCQPFNFILNLNFTEFSSNYSNILGGIGYYDLMSTNDKGLKLIKFWLENNISSDDIILIYKQTQNKFNKSHNPPNPLFITPELNVTNEIYDIFIKHFDVNAKEYDVSGILLKHINDSRYDKNTHKVKFPYSLVKKIYTPLISVYPKNIILYETHRKNDRKDILKRCYFMKNLLKAGANPNITTKENINKLLEQPLLEFGFDARGIYFTRMLIIKGADFDKFLETIQIRYFIKNLECILKKLLWN